MPMSLDSIERAANCVVHGRMYRVLSELETSFNSLADAKRFCGRNLTVFPTIPRHASELEDKTTPRVCLCTRLDDCFSAIGLLGVFRRCLSRNEDAKSYMLDGLEVYPIIVQTFKGCKAYKPTAKEVPDVARTGEVWSLGPVQPVFTGLRWLDMESILWDDNDCRKCASVRFVRGSLTGRHHPWLDGKGHILNSSEEEFHY